MLHIQSIRWSKMFRQSALGGILCMRAICSPVLADNLPEAEANRSEVPAVTQTSKNASLTYPGDSSAEVHQFLEETLAEYQEGQFPLQNVLVTGRVSRNTSKYVPGKSETPPTPFWHDFTFVTKDRVRRFQHGYTETIAGKSKEVTLYRHLDDEAIYKLDGSSLALYPLNQVDRSWGNLNFDMGIFSMPYDPGQSTWCSIGEFLDLAKERVHNDWPEFSNNKYRLSCVRDDQKILVQYVRGENHSENNQGDTTGVQFSRREGCLPERIFHQFGTPQSGLHHTCESTIHNSEVAPGVFYPQTATSLNFVGGKGPVKDGGAGWSRHDLEVKNVQVGDFECDPNLLTVKGLPIPPGTNVEDRRTVPIKSYTYGRSPVDESVLNQQLRPAPSNFRFRLIASVLTLIGFAVIVIRSQRMAENRNS